MLYIVATPIGNLQDMSLRAIEALKSADLIACEDTRHTRILLDAYGISTPTTSFFQHNRIQKAGYLLRLLREGRTIALVSDAGMPGILDPGYNIINLAVENGIALTVIPGPSAFVNALVLSGKPSHRFIFEGFLPKRETARRNRLAALKQLDCTIVCYESCHRIVSCLEDIEAVFGERNICLARELTKKFEEIRRGPAGVIAKALKAQRPRGEFVLVI